MKKTLSLVIATACLLAACSKKAANTATEALIVPGPSQVVVEPAKTKGSSLAKNTIYIEIDWVDLIPEDDLHALENPPAYLDDIEDGSAEDSLPSQLKTESSPAEDRYQQALNSKQIRSEFNGRNIRIPGFIVPLEFNDQQTITTFFLVPFFGACLHMPPPPPNQIIYAEYEPGIRLEALYDPFWIEGTLSTTLVENDMATAAYSITVGTIKPYIEDSVKK
jgi:hypothetical protein